MGVFFKVIERLFDVVLVLVCLVLIVSVPIWVFAGTLNFTKNFSAQFGVGRIYVYGSVKQQGPQEIPPDESYTVSKAIIRAGGFGDFANKRKVKLTRKNGQESTVDLKRVIEEGHTDEDFDLAPDDQIYVPQRLINM